MNKSGLANVAQIGLFDELIDVRSPGEFAIDHLPGAINCPVLDDEERARVGTLHKHTPFEAKRVGAALVSRNIARHLEGALAGRARAWRPLVYCWRGGKRSAAMAHVLREVGWHAATLEGGYKAYRREVVAQLESLPEAIDFVVVSGATGSAKSRLLEALGAQGAQVLDLEAIACHRGSVLGDLPGESQPSQKMFDSLVWAALRGFDRQRPVYVEAESRRIGQVQLGAALLERMREARCVRIDAPLAERVRFLIGEYRHFLDDAPTLRAKLSCLKDLHGAQVIDRWLAQAAAHDWQALVSDLIEHHYDPAYLRSTQRNYRRSADALALRLDSLSPEAIAQAAATLLRGHEPAVLPA